jgi:hypothetical protein
MHIVFEFDDPAATSLKPVAERRARLALRRLGWLAPRAHVRLSDVTGPLGGTDKRCQVELISESTGPVVITSIARDWRAALQSALARAAQSLLRAWQRKSGLQSRHAAISNRSARRLATSQH